MLGHDEFINPTLRSEKNNTIRFYLLFGAMSLFHKIEQETKGKEAHKTKSTRKTTNSNKQNKIINNNKNE